MDGLRTNKRLEYEVDNIDGENWKAHRYEGGTMTCFQIYDRAGKPIRSQALSRFSVSKLRDLCDALLKDWPI